jgi:hypothetical protein
VKQEKEIIVSKNILVRFDAEMDGMISTFVGPVEPGDADIRPENRKRRSIEFAQKEV